MDNLFKTRVLTKAINAMRNPGGRIFQRHFQPLLNWQYTSRLAFDQITGSERILGTISVDLPAPIGGKTSRNTVTYGAPRLAEKRLINNYEILDMRRYGELGPELMKQRIAREQKDLRNEFDRTLEFWGSGAIKGIVYDKDGVTELLNFGVPITHTITLLLGDRWSEATAQVLRDLRLWKRMIETDSGHDITGWQCWMGWKAMDCLLSQTNVLELLKYQVGPDIARKGRIASLVGIEFEEYNNTFLTDAGVRTPYIAPNQLVLIGLGDEVFDAPYLSAVADEDMQRQLFYSGSWIQEDPKGRWIYGEMRGAPVLKRPNAVIVVNVCDP